MDDQVPKAVVQERFERLMALQDRISLEENQRLVGTTVEVMVTAAEGRKSDQTHRLSGRAEDSRLVHFDVPEGSVIPRPGDVVSAVVSQAAPFYLIADTLGELPVRRTRAGDAWDRAEAASCAVPSGTTGSATDAPARVSLGLPTLRVATTPIYDTSDGLR
jgi:tRNA-2-methylthio-N6-dimethylallyladenosine synthase